MMNYVGSISILDRGDAPAQAVIDKNSRSLAQRVADETRDELGKVMNRVDNIYESYEASTQLMMTSNQSSLEYVEDIVELEALLKDQLKKKKYQQQVTIFIVGYENVCGQKLRLLQQVNDFFMDNSKSFEEEDWYPKTPDIDLDDCSNKIEDSLQTAKDLTEKISSINADIVEWLTQYAINKASNKGKKKLETALSKAKDDVKAITEQLKATQIANEEKDDLIQTYHRQVEGKTLEVQKFKAAAEIAKKNVQDLEAKEVLYKDEITKREKDVKRLEEELRNQQMEISQSNFLSDLNSNRLKSKDMETAIKLDELQNAVEKHRVELQETRRELQIVHNSEMQTLQESHTADIESLRAEYTQQMKKLQGELHEANLKADEAEKAMLSVTDMAERSRQEFLDFQLRSSPHPTIEIEAPDDDEEGVSPDSSRQRTKLRPDRPRSRSRSRESRPSTKDTRSSKGTAAAKVTVTRTAPAAKAVSKATKLEAKFPAKSVKETADASIQDDGGDPNTAHAETRQAKRSRSTLETVKESDLAAEFEDVFDLADETSWARVPMETVPGRFSQYRKLTVKRLADLEEQLSLTMTKTQRKVTTLKSQFQEHKSKWETERKVLIEQVEQAQKLQTEAEREADVAMTQLEEFINEQERLEEEEEEKRQEVVKGVSKPVTVNIPTQGNEDEAAGSEVVTCSSPQTLTPVQPGTETGAPPPTFIQSEGSEQELSSLLQQTDDAKYERQRSDGKLSNSDEPNAEVESEEQGASIVTDEEKSVQEETTLSRKSRRAEIRKSLASRLSKKRSSHSTAGETLEEEEVGKAGEVTLDEGEEDQEKPVQDDAGSVSSKMSQAQSEKSKTSKMSQEDGHVTRTGEGVEEKEEPQAVSQTGSHRGTRRGSVSSRSQSRSKSRRSSSVRSVERSEAQQSKQSDSGEAFRKSEHLDSAEDSRKNEHHLDTSGISRKSETQESGRVSRKSENQESGRVSRKSGLLESVRTSSKSENSDKLSSKMERPETRETSRKSEHSQSGRVSRKSEFLESAGTSRKSEHLEFENSSKEQEPVFHKGEERLSTASRTSRQDVGRSTKMSANGDGPIHDQLVSRENSILTDRCHGDAEDYYDHDTEEAVIDVHVTTQQSVRSGPRRMSTRQRQVTEISLDPPSSTSGSNSSPPRSQVEELNARKTSGASSPVADPKPDSEVKDKTMTSVLGLRSPLQRIRGSIVAHGMKGTVPIEELSEIGSRRCSQSANSSCRDGWIVHVTPNYRSRRGSSVSGHDVMDACVVRDNLPMSQSSALHNMKAMMEEENMNSIQHRTLESVRAALQTLNKNERELSDTQLERTITLISLASQLTEESIHLGVLPESVFDAFADVNYRAASKMSQRDDDFFMEDGALHRPITQGSAITETQTQFLPKTEEEVRANSALSRASLRKEYRNKLDEVRAAVEDRRAKSPAISIPSQRSLDEDQLIDEDDDDDDIAYMEDIKADPTLDIGTSPPPGQKSSQGSRMSQVHADHPVVTEYLRTYNGIVQFRNALSKLMVDREMLQPSAILDEIDTLKFNDANKVEPQIEGMTQNVYQMLEEIIGVLGSILLVDREPMVSSLTGGGMAVSRDTTQAMGGPMSAESVRGPTVTRASHHSQFSAKSDVSDRIALRELQEQYDRTQQQLIGESRKHDEQLRHNTVVMMEMQDTINELQRELSNLGRSSSRLRPQSDTASLHGATESAIMFTRLDSDRNSKIMKRAVNDQKMDPEKYRDALNKMEDYVGLPSQRFAHLVRKYVHHSRMKEIEENVKRSKSLNENVFEILDKMEALQNERAKTWADKMDQMGSERLRLANLLMQTLDSIEQESGIFLIKPMYSYRGRDIKDVRYGGKLTRSMRPQRNISPSRDAQSTYPPAPTPASNMHLIRGQPVPTTQHVSQEPHKMAPEPLIPLEGDEGGITGASLNWVGSAQRQTWSMNSSIVRGDPEAFLSSQNPNAMNTPRILELDINRMLIGQNTISSKITQPGLTEDRLVNASQNNLRSYITVNRPTASPGLGRPRSFTSSATKEYVPPSSPVSQNAKRVRLSEGEMTRVEVSRNMTNTPPLPPIGSGVAREMPAEPPRSPPGSSIQQTPPHVQEVISPLK